MNKGFHRNLNGAVATLLLCKIAEMLTGKGFQHCIAEIQCLREFQRNIRKIC